MAGAEEGTLTAPEAGQAGADGGEMNNVENR
jgi:hypothetical protein